jgi:hypothetical protein
MVSLWFRSCMCVCFLNHVFNYTAYGTHGTVHGANEDAMKNGS